MEYLSDELIRKISAEHGSYSIEEFQQFFSYLIDNRIEPTPTGLKSYTAYLRKQGYATATITKRISAGKAALRKFYALQEDLSPSERINLKEDLDRVRVGKVSKAQRKEYLSEDELNKLIMYSGKKTSCIIRFLSDTGCRVSEMICIRWRNVAPCYPGYHVRIDGKGLKERTVVISRELHDIIREVFNGNVFIFETGSGIQYDRDQIKILVGRAGKKILDRNISPHDFRHYYATRAIKKHPEKISQISKYLGHSNVSTTLQMYNQNQFTGSDIEGLWTPGNRCVTGKSAALRYTSKPAESVNKTGFETGEIE